MNAKFLASILTVLAALEFLCPVRALSQPSAWMDTDIGKIGSAGASFRTPGTYQITSSGADIWGAADAFHFLYQPFSGDVELVARVVAVQKTDPWAKAGLMIRAELTEDSPHTLVATTPEKGAVFIRRAEKAVPSRDDWHQGMRLLKQGNKATFQQRGSAGADTAQDSIVASANPRWIRLVRHGDMFQAYDSSDGQTWDWLGTETIKMPAMVYVGLAVSSHDVSKPCAATFDQVSVKSAGPALISPANPGQGNGIAGMYFDRMDLTGNTLRRTDPNINFDWNLSPTPGIPAERFSVRWEGELEAQYTEPYLLEVVSDDRARLWINGQLLIDEWHQHAEAKSSAIVKLEVGKHYLIRLDYFQDRGRALARLLWSSPSTPLQIIPQSQLFSPAADSDNDGLPDLWEQNFGLNPRDPSDATLDSNGDGISNLQHYLRGTDPLEIIPVQEMLGGWLSRDVGYIGLKGTATVANGIWESQGSGADIWANADGFHFVYQPLHGDGQLSARVLLQENTDPWAKVGLMIREDLSGESRHVMLAITPDHGLAVLARRSAAGETYQEWGGDAATPVWLKLERQGNVLRSFRSADGINWDWIDSLTLDLPADGLVGLAVNSHDNSRLASAGFDHVQFRHASPVPTANPVVGSGDGLNGIYFDGTTGATASRLDRNIDFDWGLGAPAVGIGPDDFSVRWEGYLQAQFDEAYRVAITSDDGSRLWLNGQLVIDNWSDHSAVEKSSVVALRAGRFYPVKLEYYQRDREALVKFLWSSPSTPKQPVPQSQVYSTLPVVPGVASSQNTTPTANSVANPSAPTTGQANPSTSASNPPGGTVSSPPKASDLTYQTVVDIPGAATVSMLGRWQADGSGLFAVDRRGYLEYNLTAPSAGMFQIEIEGASHNPYDLDKEFQLLLWMDGEYLGRSYLDAGAGLGRITQISPWIKAGDHQIRVYWDNPKATRSIEIRAVRLKSIQGPDTDGNGIADWIDFKLRADNSIDVAPQSSAVSPACIEGKGGYLSMLKIMANGIEIKPQHGAGNRWFANVPLSADGPVRVDVSYENGGLTETRQISWQPTDLSKANDLHVRVGDSLLFGQPAHAGPASASDLETIQIDGQTLYTGPAKPLAHAFANKGGFTVSASSNSAAPAGQATRVSVVEAALNGSPAAWVDQSRTWQNPALPAGVVLEADPKLKVAADAAQGTSTFDLTSDAAEPRYCVARLGQNGLILANARVDGFQIYSASQTDLRLVERYPDGSQLVEMTVVESPVLPQVTVKLQIIVGGVVFDDGTLVKDLTALDFSPLGEAVLRFIRPGDAYTSVCHILTANQNGVYLGKFGL